ncbi:MAG: RDD family protein [Terracidiphilus sp.]
MSTSPGQANLAPSWKQEVNRRIAAHKNQKHLSPQGPQALSTRQTAASGTPSRAAQAAARVAARYAKAPSYSEMLAEEARSAVRAAEAASRAALEAQAVAESVLASLEAASDDEQLWEPEPLHRGASYQGPELAWEAKTESPAQMASQGLDQSQQHREIDSLDNQPYGIRWDEDLPMRSSELAETRASRGPSKLESPAEDWLEPGASSLANEAADTASVQVVEPAPSAHANLIEFPREIVATRKMRPRRAEGRQALGPSEGQLSIFEVDPATISTEPELPAVVSEAVSPAWHGPEWSGIELDAEPSLERMERMAEAAAPPSASQFHLAPIGLRAMAAVVDGALILGASLAVSAMVGSHVKALPSVKTLEIGLAFFLATIGMLYQTLFFTLGQATPGMKYAHISLCTFDDEIPTRAQLRKRLVALLVSVLPVGLGLAWAIFDEDHMSWHDRLSRTYQRRC